MTLRQYVRDQVEKKIADVERESRKGDVSPDGVHDVRVAIRRLSELLRVFEGVFPKGTARLVRKDLKLVMKAAGDVRNCDIAEKLLGKAELQPHSELAARREQAAAQLESRLKTWDSGAAYRAWRDQLGAEAN